MQEDASLSSVGMGTRANLGCQRGSEGRTGGGKLLKVTDDDDTSFQEVWEQQELSSPMGSLMSATKAQCAKNPSPAIPG